MARMVRHTIWVLAALLMAACSQIDFNEHNVEKARVVNFNVANLKNQTATPEGLVVEDSETRATLSDAKCNYLYMLVDDALVLTQTAEDKNFGTPSMEMTLGQHKVVFIATTHPVTISNGNAVFADGTVRDAFGVIKDLNVSSETPVQNVSLDRIVGCCVILVTDAMPSNIGSATISINKHYANFKTSTLAGGTEAPFSKTFDLTGYAGSKNLSFTTYSLSPTIGTEWQANVTCTFKSTTGTTIATHTFENAAFRSNRKLTSSSPWFSLNTSSVMSVNNEWVEEELNK